MKSVATTAEHWRDLVSGTTVPIELEVAAGSSFHGSLRSFVAADIAVVRTSSVAQTVTRTSRGCRRAPAARVKVLVQHRGQAVIEQLGDVLGDRVAVEDWRRVAAAVDAINDATPQ